MKRRPDRPPERPGMEKWSSSMEVALRQLLQGYESAAEQKRTPWDFAVGVHLLEAAGFSAEAIHRLLVEGQLAHQIEQTRATDARRQFRAVADGKFTARSCFVLTEPGSAWAREAIARSRADPSEAASGPGPHRQEESDRLPVWDEKEQTLFWWDGQKVYHFQKESVRQIPIVRAFAADGWKRCLAVEKVALSKKQLRSALKNLNRNTREFLVFHLEGGGSRLRWEPAEGN